MFLGYSAEAARPSHGLLNSLLIGTSNMNNKFLGMLSALIAVMIGGCATIVNDPMVPVSLSFSDGSDGECFLRNKRWSGNSDMPGTINVRRSDDSLVYDCTTSDNRTSKGSIPSGIDAAKLGASVLFIDLGITDAITDKHRNYPASYVIPVRKAQYPRPD